MKASTTVTIQNRLGMHARPAMMFVDIASKFDADIRVRRLDNADGESFDGKSIMQVMMLAATCGTKIEISADGADAEQALADLKGLVDSGFQEE